MIHSSKISLIHVAKKQLALDDEEYRTILHSVCGVESAKDINSDEDFKALMKAFEKLGFKSQQIHRKAVMLKRPNDSPATPDQIVLIESLWQQVTKNPDSWRDALCAFLKSRFHVPDLHMLTRRKAGDVIEALKEMFIRFTLVQIFKELNPDKEASESRLYSHYKKIVRLDENEIQGLLTVLTLDDKRACELINQSLTIVTHGENNNGKLNQNPLA